MQQVLSFLFDKRWREGKKKFRGETKSEPKLKRERRKKGYLSDQKITGERF